MVYGLYFIFYILVYEIVYAGCERFDHIIVGVPVNSPTNPVLVGGLAANWTTCMFNVHAPLVAFPAKRVAASEPARYIGCFQAHPAFPAK